MKFLYKLLRFSTSLFIQGAKLYKLDLAEFSRNTPSELPDKFSFYMPESSDFELLDIFFADIPRRIDTAKERFSSGNYLCFAYIDNTCNKLAYVRWACRESYYSEAMRQELKFSSNEILTMDSYTHPDYRSLGLHRLMNTEMLVWIKNNTDFRYVYMIILLYVNHIKKIAIRLGYKPVKRAIFFSFEGSRNYLRLILKKLNG